MKRILFYGKSIFMTGLAAQLESRTDMNVRQQSLLNGPLRLGDIDVIIVDFDDVKAADILAILRARPDLKVVGVDAPGSAVTVLSGKVYLTHTLADVVQCLE